MLSCENFRRICGKHGFDFFSGVPDSTFRSWMTYLDTGGNKSHLEIGGKGGSGDPDLTNIIAVNECEAAAICAGYHLSTGKIGVLYMQNDGFGKTVNPLSSLCNPEVYSIPILLMIGWRGEPGKKDAIQHHRMGKILQPLLDLLDIPHEIMPSRIEEADRVLEKAREYMEKNSRPFAVIVRKGTFEDSLLEDSLPGKATHGTHVAEQPVLESRSLGREETLGIIMKHLESHLDGEEIIVSTTGKLSRELFEYSSGRKKGSGNDFYNIGAMGCAQSIALGIALQRKDRKVFVFDGDGSILMQMGALVTAGHYSPDNLFHFVFDNGAHDSTGGQPTCSDTVDLTRVAAACNYRYAETVNDAEGLRDAMRRIILKGAAGVEGPAMLVVKVKKGARDDLTRPDREPVEYKEEFMRALEARE